MRMVKVVALVLAIALVPMATALVLTQQQSNQQKALDRSLATQVSQQQAKMQSIFSQADATVQLLSQDPRVDQAGLFPDSLLNRRQVALQRKLRPAAEQALKFVAEEVYPQAIAAVMLIATDSKCAPEVTGQGQRWVKCSPEVALYSNGAFGSEGALIQRMEAEPYFKPTVNVGYGNVYQGKPTISRDTNGWVIPFATLLPPVNGSSRGMAHFDLNVEYFRRAAADVASHSEIKGFQLAVVDSKGKVVYRSDKKQETPAPLGDPDDKRFTSIAKSKKATGATTVSGQRMSWVRLLHSATNANDWYLVGLAPAGGGWLSGNILPIALMCLALVAIAFIMGRRWVHTSTQAMTDPLTGLGNRRKLVADLHKRIDQSTPEEPLILALFDLDGFKNYNDSYGHPAGDALLSRLAKKLATAAEPYGEAYRMGGDEFCCIARPDEEGGFDEVVDLACEALSERGEGFSVGTSVGVLELPTEAADVAAALHLADQRLYANKSSSRRSPGRQSADVLLQAVHERNPEIGDHLHDVARMVGLIGARLGLHGEELDQLKQAAELHDVGKMAIPDAILKKPGPLDQSEWDFVRGHTVIGERIVSAAPSLTQVSRWVRSSHERWNGSGYPDGLAGEEIPLPSRIIAVCDAFDAMIGPRPYRLGMPVAEALEELRRCSGTQFDPTVVERFCALVSELEAEVSGAPSPA
jgi:diguanylate cyclase (GGDEF)-like protein